MQVLLNNNASSESRARALVMSPETSSVPGLVVPSLVFVFAFLLIGFNPWYLYASVSPHNDDPCLEGFLDEIQLFNIFFYILWVFS